MRNKERDENDTKLQSQSNKNCYNVWSTHQLRFERRLQLSRFQQAPADLPEEGVVLYVSVWAELVSKSFTIILF